VGSSRTHRANPGQDACTLVTTLYCDNFCHIRCWMASIWSDAALPPIGVTSSPGRGGTHFRELGRAGSLPRHLRTGWLWTSQAHASAAPRSRTRARLRGTKGKSLAPTPRSSPGRGRTRPRAIEPSAAARLGAGCPLLLFFFSKTLSFSKTCIFAQHND
jgi:hypothetical protein